MTQIQMQNQEKKKLNIFLKYMPITQRILCLTFLMYVATIHCLKGWQYYK